MIHGIGGPATNAITRLWRVPCFARLIPVRFSRYETRFSSLRRVGPFLFFADRCFALFFAPRFADRFALAMTTTLFLDAVIDGGSG
jgi:hypothetical protein